MVNVRRSFLNFLIGILGGTAALVAASVATNFKDDAPGRALLTVAACWLLFGFEATRRQPQAYLKPRSEHPSFNKLIATRPRLNTPKNRNAIVFVSSGLLRHVVTPLATGVAIGTYIVFGSYLSSSHASLDVIASVAGKASTLAFIGTAAGSLFGGWWVKRTAREAG